MKLEGVRMRHVWEAEGLEKVPHGLYLLCTKDRLTNGRTSSVLIQVHNEHGEEAFKGLAAQGEYDYFFGPLLEPGLPRNWRLVQDGRATSGAHFAVAKTIHTGNASQEVRVIGCSADHCMRKLRAAIQALEETV